MQLWLIFIYFFNFFTCICVCVFLHVFFLHFLWFLWFLVDWFNKRMNEYLSLSLYHLLSIFLVICVNLCWIYINSLSFCRVDSMQWSVNVSVCLSVVECIPVCCHWSVIGEWLMNAKRSWWKFNILSLVIWSKQTCHCLWHKAHFFTSMKVWLVEWCQPTLPYLEVYYAVTADHCFFESAVMSAVHSA